MNQALIGLAGIVVGALLGGTGKYFTQRRDAWLKARASGLAVLADVRAVRVALDAQADLARAGVRIASWDAHAATLSAFRRGNYPSGLQASQWLLLASRLAIATLTLVTFSAGVAKRERGLGTPGTRTQAAEPKDAPPDAETAR